MKPTPLTVSLALICLSVFAIAQSGRGGGYHNRANAHLNWLSQQLGLSVSQKTQLKRILAEEGKQMTAVRQDTSLSPDQKQEKLKQVHETFKPPIMAVLTAEQQTKYNQLEIQAREKHEQKVKGSASPSPN
jgi:Spy/CpxP family protein refolding chaperone